MNMFDGLNFYANNFRYYYGFDRNSTFVRGFLNQCYKFMGLLSENDLKEIDSKFSFYTYISMIFSVGLILVFLYAVFFRFYTEIMQLSTVLKSLSLALPMMVAILLPYSILNFFFERDLQKYGKFVKELGAFKIPSKLGKNTIAGYEDYKKRILKESIVALIVLFLFTLSILFLNAVPSITSKLIKQGNYRAALGLSNVAVTVFPISSINYGHRAVAKYYLKDYKGAIEDYNLANKYSPEPVYDVDLYVVKSKILTKQQLLAEYDKSIKEQEKKYDAYSAMYSKANYLYSIGDYKAAVLIYDKLVDAFNNNEKILFSPATLYFKRGSAMAKLGNFKSSREDIEIAESMCVSCNYQENPSKWLDFVPTIDY